MLLQFKVGEKKGVCPPPTPTPATPPLTNKRSFIILILIREMQGVLGGHVGPRRVIFRLAGAEKPALLAREVIKILKWRISLFVSAGDYI